MTKIIELTGLFNRYNNWLKPEALEQANFVLWLEENWLKYTAIPNSTWTTSMKQKIINKMTWLTPWLPDMLVIIPQKNKESKIIFIELKRQKKSLSKISEDQKKWIEEINKCMWVYASVCYWADEAICLIKKYL